MTSTILLDHYSALGTGLLEEDISQMSQVDRIKRSHILQICKHSFRHGIIGLVSPRVVTQLAFNILVASLVDNKSTILTFCAWASSHVLIIIQIVLKCQLVKDLKGFFQILSSFLVFLLLLFLSTLFYLFDLFSSECNFSDLLFIGFD